MAVIFLLKDVRSSRSLTQNELAIKTGLTIGHIQKLEYGKAKSVPFETLDLLCGALECDPGDLIKRVVDSATK